MDKRVVALKVTLTAEEAELVRQAGEVLYGKGHPVRRAVVARELALRAARRLVKKPAKPRQDGR